MARPRVGSTAYGDGMVLPPTGDLLAALHVVAIPMRVPFRGVTTREVALLQGPAGWGEFGPFLEYGPVEASRWLASAVESAWVGWPRAVRDRVPVNATVPAVEPERVADVLARFPGCTTAKVKVAERGQSLADDVSRVAAVREVLGSAGRVRVDANGAWSVDDALVALARLAVYDLEYAEQPCATGCPSMPRCRRSSPSGWPTCLRGSPGAPPRRSRWPSGGSRWPTT